MRWYAMVMDDVDDDEEGAITTYCTSADASILTQGYKCMLRASDIDITSLTTKGTCTYSTFMLGTDRSKEAVRAAFV